MRLLTTACAVLLACLMLLLPLTGAKAEAVDDALARFTTDKFDDIQEGIEKLAQTGHASAEDVLAALLANRLFVRPSDKAVFYRVAAGAFHEAKAGNPIE